MGDSRQQRTGRQLRRGAGDDRRARRAAPRRPHAALWAAAGGRDYLPIAAGDRDRRATSPDGRSNSRQAAFETDQSPVRVLRGRPGSGKTTALWRAIEARSDESVLYVTWSARLRRSAEERLAEHSRRRRAGSGQPTSGRSPARSPARTCGGCHPPRAGARLGRGHSSSAVGHERPSVEGPRRPRCTPRSADACSAGASTGRQTARPAGSWRRCARRPTAASGATSRASAARRRRRSCGCGRRCPETTRVGDIPRTRGRGRRGASAGQRTARRRGWSSTASSSTRRRDLTLTEFWMLLELLRACRQRTGKSPWLLVAGRRRPAGRGQRVRVGALHRTSQQPLAQAGHVRPGGPRALSGRGSRRSSTGRASSTALVDKNRRPEKQQRQEVESEHVTGHAPSTVRVDREGTGQRDLVERLAALEGNGGDHRSGQDPPAMAGRGAPKAGPDARQRPRAWSTSRCACSMPGAAIESLQPLARDRRAGRRCARRAAGPRSTSCAWR